MLKYAFFHNPPKSNFFSLFIAFLLTKFFGQKKYLCKKIVPIKKIVGQKYIFVAKGGIFFIFSLKKHKNPLKNVNFSSIFKIC